MQDSRTSLAWKTCHPVWEARGFVPLDTAFAAAAALGAEADSDTARWLIRVFNGALPVQERIAAAARRGDIAALALARYMAEHGLDHLPAAPLDPARFERLHRQLEADPHGYLDRLLAGPDQDMPFPHGWNGRGYGFALPRLRQRLDRGRARFDRFAAARRSDIAILAGNGPSLRQMDFALFRGRDLFLSNYAVRNDALRAAARGVAVSNELVAAQEPHAFLLNDLWKFHPFWLGHVLDDTDRTVWLNAQGGEMFFSTDVRQRIAWHSTVTFFWLQILYSAGYRKVLLVGVDNSYVQQAGAREGDVLHQQGDDPNHFDPGYFRGKLWQAADTGRMAETYALARDAYAADGREIVNCGIGGRLELFRRARLEDELPPATPIPPAGEARAETGAESGAEPGAESGATPLSPERAGALLVDLGARLLLDPGAARMALERDPTLAETLARARAALPATDPRRVQFERAWAWASA